MIDSHIAQAALRYRVAAITPQQLQGGGFRAAEVHRLGRLHGVAAALCRFSGSGAGGPPFGSPIEQGIAAQGLHGRKQAAAAPLAQILHGLEHVG